MKEIEKVTAGRDVLGEFAPKFAQLNDDVLFGEVWSREDKLSSHDRSIVTIISLMAQGILDSSFGFHMKKAKENKVTKNEIVEILTHAAFYIGWPKAWGAFNIAKNIWNEKDENDKLLEYENSIIFPVGKVNEAFKKYFVGTSYLAPISTEQVGIYNVTFEPSCRNNWHIHNAAKGGGQILICVGGKGYYQEDGKEVIHLFPGDVVNIKPGVKHWHGATKDSYFSHLAIEVSGDDAETKWLEEVSDDEYEKLK